jgi:hypothetical protein
MWPPLPAQIAFQLLAIRTEAAEKLVRVFC